MKILAKPKKKGANINNDGRTIALNRRALFNYEILEKFESGLVLTGTEIKSIRAGKVDLRDAYARPEAGELWLVNAHIALYDSGSIYNHDPRRPRKLLLHRDQITEIQSFVSQKGLTVVALSLYIRNRVAKVQLGVGRGKRQYDKRRAIMNREMDMAVNAQEGAVIHGSGLIIEDYVTVGHSVVVHGDFIGEGSLLGNNCTFLFHSKLGKGCLIAANAVVLANVDIPDHSFVTGIPGEIKRQVSDKQAEAMKRTALSLVEHAKQFKESGL